mmetsp:Transcript_18054/g.30203  ORF Transcript_18054/g.30203 Transcript_18054/m.30203 type:complete len:395 (-) Transcript_18054:176-1360(-)
MDSSRTSFNLEMSGNVNLTKFSVVLQFFSKIGKYLILEVDDEAIIMRTLNDAKSAFASVEFDKNDFFDHFELQEGVGQEKGQIFTCKLLIRPLCVILRKAKKMQSLKMFNDINENGEYELVFMMSCENGIRRRHRFIYQTCDVVSAMFDDDDCNRFRVMPKVLTQLFGHIAKSIEVAVAVAPDQFKMKSFHQDTVGDNSSLAARQQPRHTMSSEMCVDPEEFDLYEFRYSDEPQELAFCCKELRAILWLCEAYEIPDLTFLFTEGGSPVKFVCEDSSITCHLVMATLEPRRGDDPPLEQEQAAARQEREPRTDRHKQEGYDRSLSEVADHRRSAEMSRIDKPPSRPKVYEKDGDQGGDGASSDDDECATQEQQPRKKSRLHRKIIHDDDDEETD